MNKLFTFSILLLLIELCSCKSKEKISQSSPKKSTHDTTQTVKKIEPQVPVKPTYQFRNTIWNTFTAKLDIEVSTTAISLPISNFSGTLRMKKDEYVWLSVSVPLLGEQGRVLITKDSVKVLNKFNKCYIIAPYSYVQKFSNIPFSLEKLQAAFLGNATADISKANFTKDSTIITASIEDAATKNIIIALVNSLEIQSNAVYDKLKKQDLKINYQQFQQINNRNIASKLEFISVQPQPATIIFEYNDMIFDKILSPDFIIPASYKKCSN